MFNKDSTHSNKTQNQNPQEASISTTKNKQENPFVSLIFNIILPVFLLEKLSHYIEGVTPLQTLVIALLFPVVYGLFDYFKRKKKNLISLFGVANILLTGGFAFYELKGSWFAIKEAAFPLLIGIGIFISIYMKKDILSRFAYNDNLFNINRINETLAERNTTHQLPLLLKKCTFLFGLSFVFSAILNFILAQRIFIPIDHIVDTVARKELLNSQVSQMTWQGMIVIALPLMGFMGFILWTLFAGLKNITGLALPEIISTQHQKKED